MTSRPIENAIDHRLLAKRAFRRTSPLGAVAALTMRARPAGPRREGSGLQGELEIHRDPSLSISPAQLSDVVDFADQCRRCARAFLQRSGQHAGVILGGVMDERLQVQRATGIHDFGGHIAVGVDRALGQAQVVAAQIRPARNLRRHEIRDAKVADGRQRPGEIAFQFAEIQIGDAPPCRADSEVAQIFDGSATLDGMSRIAMPVDLHRGIGHEAHLDPVQIRHDGHSEQGQRVQRPFQCAGIARIDADLSGGAVPEAA